MSEIQFAKTFLTTLDSRPMKLSLEHYEDPRTYPARTAYILPKNPLEMRKANSSRPIPGQEKGYNVSIKSARNPPLDISLAAKTPSTSILSLKESLSTSHAIPRSAIRLLYRKKPVADSKVLSDLVGDEDVKELELGIMVIGGAAVVGTPGSTSGTVLNKEAENKDAKSMRHESDAMDVDPSDATDKSSSTEAKEYINSVGFWNELRTFLNDKVKDQQMVEALHREFRKAYDTSKDTLVQ